MHDLWVRLLQPMLIANGVENASSALRRLCEASLLRAAQASFAQIEQP